MKILVGLLSTIENEYKECINSIKKQQNANFDIYEIKNKPKNIAHDKLYSKFQTNSDYFDLLIKIDADMVIEDVNLFYKIVNEFIVNKELDHLVIPVYDHFMGKHIWGVNVHRNTVKWNTNVDNYSTDTVQKEETVRGLKEWIVPEESPIIHHCPNPSPFQAFHFGLHRSIKAFQFNKKNRTNARPHWINFYYLQEHYHLTMNKKILFALAAARYVIDHKIDDSFIDYNNSESYKIFCRFNSMSEAELYKYAIQNIYMRLLVSMRFSTILTKLTYEMVFLIKFFENLLPRITKISNKKKE